MQVTVPAARTVRVVTRRIEESVGHVELAASLLCLRGALAAPKPEGDVIRRTL